MATGTQMQQAGEGAAAKSSPDYINSTQGGIERTEQQSVPGDDFVELKYRSLDNLATAKLAKGLGVFSIALGLAEVLIPAQLGEMSGLSPRFRNFLPLLGAREIAHGLGILASAKPTTAVMTRVGGDAIDIAFLGAAFMADDTNKRRLTGATLAVLGVGLLDAICATKLAGREWSEQDGNPNAPTTVGQPSGRRAFIA
jgi:hypothetical protein